MVWCGVVWCGVVWCGAAAGFSVRSVIWPPDDPSVMAAPCKGRYRSTSTAFKHQLKHQAASWTLRHYKLSVPFDIYGMICNIGHKHGQPERLQLLTARLKSAQATALPLNGHQHTQNWLCTEPDGVLRGQKLPQTQPHTWVHMRYRMLCHKLSWRVTDAARQ